MQQPPQSYGSTPQSPGYPPQGPPPGLGQQAPPPKKKRGCLLPLLGIFGALIAIMVVVGKCNKSQMTSPTVTDDATLQGAATAASPANDGIDDGGTEKRSGPFLVTLKESAIQGKNARLTFLLKNERDKEVSVSSMMMFQATTEDGDVSRPEMDGQCDGKAPPSGSFKCKLAFAFEKPPKELTIRVGATLRADDAVYFKIKSGTK